MENIKFLQTIENIDKYNPKSILEIGSNCGPNLFLLSKYSLLIYKYNI